ncbi:MAG TPA: lmo0937 family membrane protein [Fimbriimonas sp.]|nr:lmo0937 family membrane protein [Fimbriimonas sp.]
MLEAIIVLLVVLWLLGAFAVHVGGAFIHLLLLLAVVVLVIRLLRGSTSSPVV